MTSETRGRTLFAEVPTAEVLTIGDELCRGEIVDTNSAYLAERLTALGLHVRWRTSVTDDPPDMVDALERAAQRAHVIVTSGGLGPTDDDRTVDVLCGLLGVEPEDDAPHAERMRARFAARGFALTPNNLRQVCASAWRHGARQPDRYRAGLHRATRPGAALVHARRAAGDEADVREGLAPQLVARWARPSSRGSARSS